MILLMAAFVWVWLPEPTGQATDAPVRVPSEECT